MKPGRKYNHGYHLLKNKPRSQENNSGGQTVDTSNVTSSVQTGTSVGSSNDRDPAGRTEATNGSNLDREDLRNFL